MKSLNILDAAIRTGVFQTFTRLLEGSQLETRLRSNDSFTLFAPVDIAFAYLPPDTLNQLLDAENQGTLSDVLGYHAVAGKIMARELSGLSSARTVCGAEIVISNKPELRVDGARLLHLDIQARNGVIHGIDRLMLPAQKAASTRH